MTRQPMDDSASTSLPSGVELILLPRTHDIGGFEVRRALPAKERQMVGPFIFFDQMGPGEFLTGRGLDVRPHPHIGLATVTYLFEGEILHRDSLGSAQPIRPGDVNWMTAGHGIAHSERTDPAQRVQRNRLFGIQSWVALPRTQEETAPTFVHHPGTTLPLAEEGGMRLRLVAGTGWGLAAPVAVSSPLFYADATLDPGAAVPLPAEHEERGAYVLQGAVEIAGTRFEAGECCCSVPATSSRSAPGRRGHGCCCWAARRWTDRASSSGTSSPPPASGSSRQRRTGRKDASARSPATSTSSSLCPEERVRVRADARLSEGDGNGEIKSLTC